MPRLSAGLRLDPTHGRETAAVMQVHMTASDDDAASDAEDYVTRAHGRLEGYASRPLGRTPLVLRTAAQRIGYAVPHQPTTTGEAMQITIDTHNLTDLDRELLTRLAATAHTAPMPARAPKPKASPAEPEPKVTAVPPVAKEAGDDPADDVSVSQFVADAVATAVQAQQMFPAPTMADALAAATQAVSSGGSAKVKAALAGVNSKRVSEMKEEDIPAFLAALSAG